MTRRLLLSVVLSGLALATPTPAEELFVCVRDLAQLKKPARQVLLSELRLLFPRVDVTTDLNPCDAGPAADVVQLILLRRRSDVPRDVLGLTMWSRGRILPRIEVFSEPVAEFTRAGDLQTLGRALGRVAAHELGHYVRQTTEHDEKGPMRADLPSSELVAADRSPFLDFSLQR